jgi:hypothetical protein
LFFFVNIGGIVDHHCLNLLFVIYLKKKQKKNTFIIFIVGDFDKIPFRDDIGKACTAITLDGEKRPIQSFQFCRKNLKYICEHYNATGT